MAILGKIRERSMFLIIIIALALFSFVLTGLFDNNSPLFNKSTNIVGEINGETITREDFAQLVEQQGARSGNRTSQLQNVKVAWDNLVREKIYKTQLEKSGIVVGEKDVWDEIIRQSFVQNSPLFKNEIGIFDEEKLKEYIATLKDNSQEDDQGKQAWLGWLSYEGNIKSNLELNTYSNLIKAGLGATLKEGERDYVYKNTKVDVEYVHIPFNSIADSLVTITDSEIRQYVKAHKDDYIVEPTRNLSFVKFEMKATPKDEIAIEKGLKDLINDRDEYSSAAKTTVKIIGFENATDITEFFRENSSDTPLDNNYYTKNKVLSTIVDSIFKLNVGEIYGPYKDKEYFKLTKVTAIKQLPDSVKARHILLPFLGARSADATITQTEEQVKKIADSLLSVLKKDRSKFSNLAKNLSSDKGSGAKGGDLGWFTYNRMVPEFRDFTFEGQKGDIGIVKTMFGFHIIEIEGQKNLQKAFKLATFSRKIEASEETENAVFEKAETFASDLSSGKDFNELAKENKYTVQPVIGLKVLDEKVSSLNNQRPIVTWAFDKSTEENEIKRFDTDNGYAVVKLTKKNKKGLSIGNSKFQIRNILMNEKKAKIIKEKLSGTTLEEIAKTFNTSVNSSKAVSLGSPVLPNVGRSLEIAGIFPILEPNKLYNYIQAKNAVFAIKINKKELPVKIENYQSLSNIISRALQNKGSKAYDILKKSADIEDNRSLFY